MHRLLPWLGLSLLGCAPTTRHDQPDSSSPATSTAPAPAPTQASAASTSSALTPPSLPDRPADTPEALLGELADAQNGFGFQLYRALDTKGNFVLSPSSIAMALGMTGLGARGETAAEMHKTLGLSQGASQLEKGYATLLHDWQAPNDSGLQLRVANRIFVEQSLKVEAGFRDVTQRAFGAPFEVLDFKTGAEKARHHINQWVETQTQKRIVDLLPPNSITDETRLVLTNALYFKAHWLEEFMPAATSPAAFWVDGSTEKQVPMMRRTHFYNYAKLDGVQIVELQFHGDFAFDVIVPDARDGWSAVERELSAATWSRWMAALSGKRVELSLPKFRVEPGASLELKKPLQSMGMQQAFERGKADFTGIANPPSPDDRVYIGQVFHKAFVDVNEKGAEAAAATAVVMPRAGSAMRPEEPIRVVVDRPFLFAIRDKKTNTILFLGRVTEPKPGSG